MRKTYRWHIKNKIKTYYSECYHAGQIFRVVVPDNFDFGGNGCVDVSYEHYFNNGNLRVRMSYIISSRSLSSWSQRVLPASRVSSVPVL